VKEHRGNGVEFRGDPKGQLLSRISKNPTTGCWIWMGALFQGSGYGQFSNRELSKSPTTAHRAAWEILKGPIPAGKMVLHKCDNRKCVNPDHLYCGSNAENMRDRSLRGYVHQMRLDEGKVREMRKLRQAGWPWRKLAAKYDVHTNAIIEATMGRSWAYVDEPIPTIKIGPGRRKGG